MFPQPVESEAQLETSVSLNLAADGPELVVTAGCERHAALLGCALLQLPMVGLGMALEYLDE